MTWPRCARCQREARPGLACEREDCPFVRHDGVIGEGMPGVALGVAGTLSMHLAFREAIASVALSHAMSCRCAVCRANEGEMLALAELYDQAYS